jgi:hypothetical protein
MSPDALWVWVALGLAATAFLGVATGFPTTPPPEASAAANAIDAVAASGSAATATHPVLADSVRLGPHRVALRNGAGSSSAALAYGPVVVVGGRDGLAAVLDGAWPGRIFDGEAAFRRALAAARDRTPTWRGADSIHVRHVSWRGVDVTLVGT